MSHITAQASMELPHGHGPGGAAMRPANVTLAPGAGRGLSAVLFLLAIIGLGATVFAGVTVPGAVKHALGAYHIGVMTVLAMSLGAMFFTLLFHLMGAGWAVSLRRQFENVMSLIPLCLALLIPVLVVELLTGGHLFVWMSRSVVQSDVLYQKKAGYLEPMFFVIRAIVYGFLWTYLSMRLVGYSREQDRTGDKWLSNRARFTSSWGMLVFALTLAFASFDWLMSLDYQFFSTMWGVYYFAGAAFCSVPVVVIVLGRLRSAGKLEGLVGPEHFHDLGKLMFAFTVFWAYIGFGQYFLIWYSNIPEETRYFLARKGGPDGAGEWSSVATFLVVGHFVVPFFILLWRTVRRSYTLLTLMAVLAIFMEVVDIYWIVRPMVYAGAEFPDKVHLDRLWIDVAGVGGVLALYGAFLVRRVASGPLVPLKDPKMPEALHHRNYV